MGGRDRQISEFEASLNGLQREFLYSQDPASKQNKFILSRPQTEDLKQRLWSVLHAGLFSTACSGVLLVTIQDHLPSGGTAYSVLGLPCWLLIKRIQHRLAGHILLEVPLFPDDCHLCQEDILKLTKLIGCFPCFGLLVFSLGFTLLVTWFPVLVEFKKIYTGLIHTSLDFTLLPPVMMLLFKFGHFRRHFRP